MRYTLGLGSELQDPEVVVGTENQWIDVSLSHCEKGLDCPETDETGTLLTIARSKLASSELERKPIQVSPKNPYFDRNELKLFNTN